VLGAGIPRNRKHYYNLPPVQKNRFRAWAGAFLLACALYWAIDAAAYTGTGFLSLVLECYRGPTPRALTLVPWAAVTGYALLWLLVGMRNAHGGRDEMSAFWGGVFASIFAALLWTGAFPSPGRDQVGIAIAASLRGIYIAGLVASTVHFALAANLFRGNARRIVASQLRKNTAVWRPARRRWWHSFR
jgi:hypothetical protein